MRAFDAPSGQTYFHNGDFSGNVQWTEFYEGRSISFVIPFEDMKALVAQYLRMQAIEKLENASNDEILGSK